MTDPTPDTAALRQAAQAARDAAAAQRWDDLAARLRHEAAQCDLERSLFGYMLRQAARQCQAAAEGLRALAAGEQA